MADRPIPARRGQPPGVTPARLAALMAARFPRWAHVPLVDPAARIFPADVAADPDAARAALDALAPPAPPPA